VPAAAFLTLGFGHVIVQPSSLIWGAVATGLAAFVINLFGPLEKRRVTDVAALERRRARMAEKAGED
jgi:heme exporter protein D